MVFTHEDETREAAPARWGSSWQQREPWLELFRELAAGRQEALSRLYDLAAHRLHGLALWRTGSREDAAEVVQEVFVRLAQRHVELGRVADPRWWLIAVTHRLAVDVTRRRRQRAAEPIEEHPYLAAPERDHARALDAARAWALLRRVSPRQREVIFLHHGAGMSFSEVGRAIGIPAFTAASRYRLGLAALRRLLGRTS